MSKFSQSPNLHTFITSSLFNVMAVLALHLLLVCYPCSAINISLPKIISRSFRYASPSLRNRLLISLRQPHSGTSLFPTHLLPTCHFFLFRLATLLIRNSRLKSYLLHKSFQVVSLLPPDRRSISSEQLGFPPCFLAFCQLLSACKYTISYRQDRHSPALTSQVRLDFIPFIH